MNATNVLTTLLVESGAAVRCSAWLGCWLRIIWCGLFVAWLVVFILWVRALSAYAKSYREYQESHGEPYQSLGKNNKLLRLLLQSLARNISNVTQVRKQNSHVINGSGVQFGMVARLLRALHHAHQSASNFLAVFFDGHKSGDARKQPNDPSSATRPARRSA